MSRARASACTAAASSNAGAAASNAARTAPGAGSASSAGLELMAYALDARLRVSGACGLGRETELGEQRLVDVRAGIVRRQQLVPVED